MNSRNTSLVALSAALALTAIAKVWADDVCTPCLCTGNATCQGCHIAYAVNDCDLAQVDGVYVDVPLNSFYNYCEPSFKEEDICISKCVTCFTAKKGADIYSDHTCVTGIASLGDDRYIFASGACVP